MIKLKEGDIVTLSLENETISNTFILAQLVDDGAYLTHPLSPGIFIKKNQIDLNKVSPTVRCSSERALSFLSKNTYIFDYRGKMDLKSLCICFVVNRELTPNQMKIVADLSGKVAKKKFIGNVKKAMEYITENEALLDDFNRLWYNNFSKLFRGSQEISSSKQSSAIFNMAGFVLGELDPNEVDNGTV